MNAVHRSTLLAVTALAMVLPACGSDAGGSDASGSPARTVEVTAKEYSFNGDPGSIVAGDTIEFVVQNVGQLDHSMEVLSAEGRSLGKTGRIPAGASDGVVVTFEEAGNYRLICDIDDHLSRGQSANLSIAE